MNSLPAPTTQRFVPTPQGGLHLATWQGTDPNRTPLLALHGFTGDALDFAPLAQELPSYTLHALDLPGHGPYASRSPRLLSMESCLQTIRWARQALSLVTFDLLGYSMGGRVALHYATGSSSGLERLVLIGATPGLEQAEERHARRLHDERLATRIEQEGNASFLSFWEEVPIIQSQQAIPTPWREAMRQRRLNASPQGWASSLRGYGTGAMAPVWGKLGELETPTLLMTGIYDTKFTGIARRMSLRMPHSLRVLVPEAGHAPHLEQRDLVAMALQNFLSVD